MLLMFWEVLCSHLGPCGVFCLDRPHAPLPFNNFFLGQWRINKKQTVQTVSGGTTQNKAVVHATIIYKIYSGFKCIASQKTTSGKSLHVCKSTSPMSFRNGNVLYSCDTTGQKIYNWQKKHHSKSKMKGGCFFPAFSIFKAITLLLC